MHDHAGTSTASILVVKENACREQEETNSGCSCFMRRSAVVVFAISALAFVNVGQALLSNGECIRFLGVPFTNVGFRVAESSSLALLVCCAVSAVVAFASLLVNRKHATA
jgi:hypothetical protein